MSCFIPFQTYCSEKWTSHLVADSWDTWSFFLVEGTTIKWNVTSNSKKPSLFYLFGSADDYNKFISDKPVKPVATSNDTSFQGNVSVDAYNEYFFVAKAADDIRLNWQVEFWKAVFDHNNALESCDVAYGLCRLKTNKNVCCFNSHHHQSTLLFVPNCLFVF